VAAASVRHAAARAQGGGCHRPVCGDGDFRADAARSI
jgi:hypothetical protein